MDIVLVTQILSRMVTSKDFCLTVKENNISTIKSKYIGIIDYGKNSKKDIKVYFVEEVNQDDVLRHNSQFNKKDFVSKYYVKHRVFVAEALNNQLKKIIIINHRRSKWKR
jgi:hypothetical protein